MPLRPVILALAVGCAAVAPAAAARPAPSSQPTPASPGATGGDTGSSQERWLFQGLADASYFDTDDGSRLLSVNDGKGTGIGMLRLWAAGDLGGGVQAFALGAVRNEPDYEAGAGRATDTALEQGYLRYTAPGKARLMIEAGRLVTPVGDFSPRYLPSSNPLIGQPSDYSVAYPEGMKVQGWIGRFDMMGAVVNRPLSATWYAPVSDKDPRPMLSAGWTPIAGLRAGLFATRGTYLGSDYETSLAPGDAWRDFNQSVAGFEAKFSRAHFDFHGQYVSSSYEVPGLDRLARGRAYYVEPRYTFTPRLFGALRWERNDYPYIAPIFGTTWIASNAEVSDIEAGVGVNILPDLTAKVSYRRDFWRVQAGLEDLLPDGHAFAAQLVYHFDVRGLIERPR
ncbi:MAG TPA: hypothetical protein VGQ67_10200 [Candidatus Polarisedimenticolia bacterium]|jgi:hypothetical protein|nr:hypothetical protein [Candidatus Polarisedimenticolia bacterium]